MKQFKINLYKYDELDTKAKDKAFEEHEIFLRENPQDYEDENGNIQYDDMDKWTLKDIEEYVEDSIRTNEYYFFSTGKMAHTITYYGNHEKAGKTELIIGKEHIKEVD